ncbi:hypothetical protein BT93_E1059 [Corymbia citriodora subsp. variegata]|nr:hypothetical protein BT93_E1059 [Corymbia citriodora subsp. variegata]
MTVVTTTTDDGASGEGSKIVWNQPQHRSETKCRKAGLGFPYVRPSKQGLGLASHLCVTSQDQLHVCCPCLLSRLDLFETLCPLSMFLICLLATICPSSV